MIPSAPTWILSSRTWLAAALPPVCVLAGCAGEGAVGPTVTTTDSAGIAITQTFSPDLPALLTSDRLRTLGGRETTEESFFRVGSWNVATDGNDRLYVLDRDGFRVQVFDSTGRHLRTLGGRGGGPGELQFPFTLTVAEDGRAWVADVGKRALVHWDPEGRVLESEALLPGYTGGEVKWTSSGMVFSLQGGQGQRLVLVSGEDEPAELASLLPGETRPIQLASCGMGFSGLEPIFSPNLVWAASWRTVAVARNPTYVIDLYEDGRLVRSLRRDVPPQAATEALATASLGDGMRVLTEGGERICDPAEVVAQRGFASHLPMVAQLAVSPDGTLWVRRFAVTDAPSPIDLFDPAGHYVGTLPEGTPFPIGFLSDGRMLVAERDALDVERLVVRTAELTLPGGE